jgi:hypothetical protein
MTQREELQRRIALLYDLFQRGGIKTLTTQHEVHPDLPLSDRVNYVYFTLPVSLNFQRSSTAMWQSALKTFEDPETNYLFYPEEVIRQSREKVQKDLGRHRLALQTNKHTDIWIRLSQTLHTFFNDNPKEIIESCGGDVIKIVQMLRKDRKKDFPYLSGGKMSNYWLFILSRFTDIELKNTQEISIIPDTHVIQCSHHLGVSQSEDPEKIAEAWKDLMSDMLIHPVDMHPVLWNWSRAGFEPNV